MPQAEGFSRKLLLSFCSLEPKSKVLEGIASLGGSVRESPLIIAHSASGDLLATLGIPQFVKGTCQVAFSVT